MSDTFDRWWKLARQEGRQAEFGGEAYQRIRAAWRKCCDRVVLPGWLIARLDDGPEEDERRLAEIRHTLIPGLIPVVRRTWAMVRQLGPMHYYAFTIGSVEWPNESYLTAFTSPGAIWWLYVRNPLGEWELVDHYSAIVQRVLDASLCD